MTEPVDLEALARAVDTATACENPECDQPATVVGKIVCCTTNMVITCTACALVVAYEYSLKWAAARTLICSHCGHVFHCADAVDALDWETL